MSLGILEWPNLEVVFGSLEALSTIGGDGAEVEPSEDRAGWI